MKINFKQLSLFLIIVIFTVFLTPRIIRSSGNASTAHENLPRINNKADAETLTQKIDKLLTDNHPDDRVGYSVLISKNKRNIYSKISGYADLEYNVPVDSNTLFAIASVNKAFTGIALLKLYSEGKIDLNSPIQKYVPQFPPNKDAVITINMLAAHLSGIRHYGRTERNADFFSKHYQNVADAINIFIKDSLNSPPGSKYQYSSYGYNLLAAAIQNAAGEKFQDYVKGTVLMPLSLSSTMFDDVRLIIPNRAQSYGYYDAYTYTEHDTLFRTPTLDFSYNPGGGNLLSTAEDLIKFGEALISPGFLSEKEFNMLYTNQIINGVESPWSYGWIVSKDDAGNKYIKINGSFPSFQADLWVFPDDKTVIVVLENFWGKFPKDRKPSKPIPLQIFDLVSTGQ